MIEPGSVAVVTGGANGIGRAITRRFLQEGARVVIGDVNEANAGQVLAEAQQAGHGDRLRFIPTNVAVEADVEAMFDLAVDAFGRIDCVVNNAGVGGAFGPIVDTSVGDWDNTMAVLLRGVFLGMKHGARQLKAHGQGGSIISTSSVAAFAAGSGAHAYSAAKAAIVNLTRSVAIELAPHRIRVNSVAPGPLMTDLFHRGRAASAEQRIRDRQPWPDLGRPEDIAGVVAFLASPDAKFITGETIVVDGGLLARGPALFGDGADNLILRGTGMNLGSTGMEPDARQEPAQPDDGEETP